MRRLTLAAAAVLMAGAAQAAELEISRCEFPEPPAVPDGSRASQAEMGEAGTAVRAYVSQVQSALECLAEAESALGDEVTEEQQAVLVETYNSGVDAMNGVAESYNEQVRAFKER